MPVRMIILLATLLAFAGCLGGQTNQRDVSADLILEISTTTPTVIAGGGPPNIEATITNKGNSDVTLVLPGDGSEVGWRTPITTFIVARADGKPLASTNYGRCGNRNALEADEIFVLKPGEKRSLGKWLPLPLLQEVGTYNITLTYTNDPSIKWCGLPLGNDNPRAMNSVRNSSPCKLTSNVITVEVKPKK